MAEKYQQNVTCWIEKMPGLCVGVCGVRGNEQPGCTVFCKNVHDKERFEFYQKNVLLQFINSLHLEYADFDVSDGTSILNKLTAVAWCDGDLLQVNAIINDHGLFTDMKVIANTKNAARSGVELSTDIAKVFVIFKQHKETHTVSNVDPFRHLMKRRVTKAFESDRLKVLNQNSKKKNCL